MIPYGNLHVFNNNIIWRDGNLLIFPLEDAKYIRDSRSVSISPCVVLHGFLFGFQHQSILITHQDIFSRRCFPRGIPCGSLDLFLCIMCYYLCNWMWVIKRKEEVRMKKKKGVFEACLLFCWILIIVYFKKLFRSKFGRFSIF